MPKDPLPKISQGFKGSSVFKRDPFQAFGQMPRKTLAKGLLANLPDVSKSCLRSGSRARSPRYQTMPPLFTEELPSSCLPKRPLPTTTSEKPTLPVSEVAKLFIKGLLQLLRLPYSLPEIPPSASQSFPPNQAISRSSSPRRVPTAGTTAPETPVLRSFSELDARRRALRLTTASSLSVLGATSPGNLMMGDGAAAARLHRQLSRQSTRSGRASAPRAPRASVIALPGPERRLGGRWLGACGRVAAWLAPAPPRGAALRGAARLSGLGLARLSGAWSGPRVPSPRRRRSPFPPVLAAPFVCF